MPTVLDADLRPCCAVSRASILSNQICSSCSVASVSRSKVRQAVCSRARDAFDYAGLCACAAGSRVLLTPFQPHVLGLVAFCFRNLTLCVAPLLLHRCKGATRCSPPTRNGPQRAERVRAARPGRRVVHLHVPGGSHDIRCAPRASELCKSQRHLCVPCVCLCVWVCVLHGCFVSSLRPINAAYCMREVCVMCGALRDII